MTWWKCSPCSVYWQESTEAEYSVCWNCAGSTGTPVPRLYVRHDTSHSMSFPDTTVMDPALD